MATKIDYDNLKLRGFILSDCDYCKYFSTKRNNGVINYICPAFPKGIPDNIVSGKKSHQKKMEGQVGDCIFEYDEMYIK